MNKKVSLLIVALVMSGGIYGQGVVGDPSVRIPEMLPTVKSVQMIEQNKMHPTVSYLKDIPYVSRESGDLYLQILTPTSASQTPKPCIVYIQGSAWMKQDVYRNIPQLANFAARGYVIAIVEYRHSGIASFPAQLLDAKTAIRFMRKNAEKYGVDVNNLFIWGDSSGGHTSLFAGITIGDKEFTPTDYGDISDEINGIIAYYPPTDLSVMKDVPSGLDHNSPKSPEGILIGGKKISENMQAARNASPLYYVKTEKPIAPIFIAHGTMDKTVPFSQSDLMAAKLEQCDKVYEYYALKGADHGSWEFWTPQMFDKVETFIKKYIKNGY